MKNVPEKNGNYQTFLASLKGGYPQFGKTPNFFRFFLMKVYLKVQIFLRSDVIFRGQTALNKQNHLFDQITNYSGAK